MDVALQIAPWVDAESKVLASELQYSEGEYRIQQWMFGAVHIVCVGAYNLCLHTVYDVVFRCTDATKGFSGMLILVVVDPWY